ncbi:exodeoxyribonuclease III [Rhodovibrionaceae bacterium A322]
MTLRIASWNVNSLRQRLEHLAQFNAEIDPHVVCLQETKVVDELFPQDEIKAMGFEHLIFHGQKSYNGVAILSKLPFLSEEKRVWCNKDDRRHVSVTLEGDLELHNFYVPSGGPTPDPEKNDKFAHKLSFLEEMKDWAATEAKDKKLLMMGDFNVAPLENDVWNHKKLLKSVGHTPGESERVAAIQSAGNLTDIGRHFVPADQPLYSWWGYRYALSVQKDYGWRLDHAWATASLMPQVKNYRSFKDSRLWEKPSDHIPVIVDID